MKVPPITSVIIATYNWPEALCRCLQSVSRQKVLPKEVVIADDGSGLETRLLIEQLRTNFPVPIIHVWQEDLGFRKAEILNKAVKACSGEYLIQIDGDVILHRHFIRDHHLAAEAGMFVRGSRARLTSPKTDEILGDPDKHLHLFSTGLLNKLNAVHLPQLSFLTHKKRLCSRSVRGSNLAFWKRDFVLVNGYNNDLQGWGHEDEELAARFVNNGIFKKIVKLSAIQYHLHHAELEKDKETFHRDVLKDVVLNKIKTCPNGFGQFAGNPSAGLYAITKSASSRPVISIVIVTLNVARYLQRCLDSIYMQDYPALQIIVIDGGSSDGTTAILEQNTDRISYWSSEKDGGVYYAMNKAVEKADGEWIYFIGADDELTPEFSKLAAQLKNKNTIYYGSVWKDQKKYLGKLSAYKHAKTGINHQAMIYPASVFRKYRYDTDYSISADHVLNMWCWKDPTLRFEFIDHIIATFSTDGLSSNYKDQLFERRKAGLILHNYGLIVWARFLFKQFKAARKVKNENTRTDRTLVPVNILKQV